MTRSGRRPGASTTKAALIEAAKRRFAETGFDATSLRVIAADAGVDPAVVIHFFGSKEGLFRAAVGWPFDPALVTAQIATLDPAVMGASLGRVFLGAWEDPDTRASLMALLRSAMTQPASANLLSEFVDQQLFGTLSGLIKGPEPDLRVNLAAAQMIGVAVLRYILVVEPIASASNDQLMEWLSPVLSHYLDAAESGDNESSPASPNDRAPNATATS